MSGDSGRDAAGQEFSGARPVDHPNGPGRLTRANRALWIAGAVVLVVAIVVVVVISVSGDDEIDPDNPTGVANAVVDALNAEDEDLMRPLMCEPRVPNVLANMKARSGDTQYHAWLEGSAMIDGYSATARVIVKASDSQGDTDLDFTLYLAKRGSGWCADQFSGPASYTQL